MGLREDAEKSRVEAEKSRQEELRKSKEAVERIRAERRTAVRNALLDWCTALEIHEVPNYKVTWGGHGGWDWDTHYSMVIKFVVESIPLRGMVVFDDRSDWISALQVKIDHPSIRGWDEPIRSLTDLGYALDEYGKLGRA